MNDIENKGEFVNVRAVANRFSPKLAGLIPGFVYGFLEKILHIAELNEILGKHANDEPQAFLDGLLNELNLKVKFSGNGIESITAVKDKPLMLVSNHPYGGPEAIALLDVFHGIFPNSKLVAQSFLSFIKPLKEVCVFNKKDVRTLVNAVNERNPLLIYPAGICSRKLSFGEVFDYQWVESFVKIAKNADMPICVIYTDGQLSPRMHRWTKFRNIFGIKTTVETLFLVDEMFKLKGKTIDMVVGSIIDPAKLDDRCSKKEWAARLRQYCYELRKSPNAVFDYDKPATLPEK